MQRETSAHCLGDRHFNLLLRSAGLGPIPLHYLVAMFDFDESSSGIVTCSPERQKFVPRLHLPFGCRNQVGHLDGQSRFFGLQHLQRQLSRYFLAESILSRQDDPVSSRRQIERQGRISIGIGGKTLFGDDLAEPPVVCYRKISFG